MLIGEQRLKVGSVYFKVRVIIHMKLEDFAVFSFQIITLNNYQYDI